MSTSTQPPYHDRRLRQFGAVTPDTLLPLVRDLRSTLEAAGVWTTIRDTIRD